MRKILSSMRPRRVRLSPTNRFLSSTRRLITGVHARRARHRDVCTFTSMPSPWRFSDQTAWRASVMSGPNLMVLAGSEEPRRFERFRFKRSTGLWDTGGHRCQGSPMTTDAELSRTTRAKCWMTRTESCPVFMPPGGSREALWASLVTPRVTRWRPSSTSSQTRRLGGARVIPMSRVSRTFWTPEVFPTRT